MLGNRWRADVYLCSSGAVGRAVTTRRVCLSTVAPRVAEFTDKEEGST
jgi:hypothetical protein